MSMKTADLRFEGGEGEVRRRWPMRAPRSWAIQWMGRVLEEGPRTLCKASRMERPMARLS